MRNIHESCLHRDSGGSAMVTLTYRDKAACETDEQLEGKKHVPEDWSLSIPHLQKFLKRYRERVKRRFKYFAVGEYGSTCMHGINLDLGNCSICSTGRPHYHILLHGVAFDDLRRYGIGHRHVYSKSIEETWGFGLTDVSPFNPATANYVCRYVLKKVTGPRADTHYFREDLDGNQTYIQPEFATMSRGGRTGKGLGYDWAVKSFRDIYPRDEVPVSGVGIVRGVPRYYDELFAENPDNETILAGVKAERQKFRDSHRELFTRATLTAAYKIKCAELERKQSRTL
jgi:hypothetical protein